jgi:dihydropyrimidinase
MKSKLIRSGLVCFEDGIRKADIYIKNGKISSVNTNGDAFDVIDAEGLYILPGMIDIHTHLDDNIGKYNLADNYRTGSEIAVLNGITTLYSFITQGKNESLRQAIERAKLKSAGNTFCDIMWHLTPTGFGEKNWDEIIECAENDFKTFKFYTTYEHAGIYSSYEKLEIIFERLKKYNLTFLIHCEDNDIINAEAGKKYDLSKPFTHALLRPKEAEIKAIKKLIKIAKKHDVKIHIVHVSTSEGAELVEEARGTMNITCETAPHYLFLSDDYLKKENGHKWICSPPLRDEQNSIEMKKKALEGCFDIFATDHCAFGKADKNEWLFSEERDVRKVPNGIAGIGALPHLTFKLYSDNFNHAIYELSRRLSANPAKITGIYPKKGVIKEGADADLVILNQGDVGRNIISSLSDTYETYPGFRTNLSFKYVYVRGEIVVKDDKIADGNNLTGKELTNY